MESATPAGLAILMPAFLDGVVCVLVIDDHEALRMELRDPLGRNDAVKQAIVDACCE